MTCLVPQTQQVKGRVVNQEALRYKVVFQILMD